MVVGDHEQDRLGPIPDGHFLVFSTCSVSGVGRDVLCFVGAGRYSFGLAPNVQGTIRLLRVFA